MTSDASATNEGAEDAESKRKHQTELTARRVPRQPRAQATVQHILQSALKVIEDGGLDRLTTNHIAAASGMSVGTLYVYFPNKEAILYALLGQWLADLIEAIDGCHPRHGDARDILTYTKQIVSGCAVLYEKQPGMGALFGMLGAMPALEELDRKYERAALESLSSAFRSFVPQAPQADIDAISQCVLHMVHEVLTLAYFRRTAESANLLNYLQAALMAMSSRLLMAS